MYVDKMFSKTETLFPRNLRQQFQKLVDTLVHNTDKPVRDTNTHVRDTNSNVSAA